MTGGLAAPLVAAGAGAVLGAGGAAALGSATGIAIMASLFGAAGAGLTGKALDDIWLCAERSYRVYNFDL